MDNEKTVIDTTNKFLVMTDRSGEKIRIGWLSVMTPDDALLLAAYLVSMGEPRAKHAFIDVLNAVQSA